MILRSPICFLDISLVFSNGQVVSEQIYLSDGMRKMPLACRASSSKMIMSQHFTPKKMIINKYTCAYRSPSSILFSFSSGCFSALSTRSFCKMHCIHLLCKLHLYNIRVIQKRHEKKTYNCCSMPPSATLTRMVVHGSGNVTRKTLLMSS